MALTRTFAGQNDTNSNGSTLSITGVDTTGYDYAVVFYKHEGGSTTLTFSDNQSNTWTKGTYVSENNNDLHAQAAYAKLDTTSGSHSFTVTGGANRQYRDMRVYLIDSAGATVALDVETTADSNADSFTDPGGGNLVTSAASVCMHFVGGYASLTYTAGSGWTEDSDTANNYNQSRSEASSGTFALDCTPSGDTVWVSIGLAFVEQATAKTANGAGNLPALTASGSAVVKRIAAGVATLAVLTVVGTATITRHASGSANLPALTASGATVLTRHASGSASLPALTASGVAAASKIASGSVSLPVLTASGVAVIKHQASGVASLPALSVSGAAVLTRHASGSASLPALTATGSATRIPAAADVTADGSGALPSLTASGTAVILPKVWLNTSESKSGADQMTVVSANEAGTQVVFDDPSGGKTGSLYLGVERYDGEIGWIAVNVGEAGNITAYGGASLPALTASSGIANVISGVAGSPTLPALTASGTSVDKHVASGSVSLPALTASGSVTKGAVLANGSANLPVLTASGAAVLKHQASSSSSLPALTASGQAIVKHPASGAASIPALTASGTATNSAESVVGPADIVVLAEDETVLVPSDTETITVAREGIVIDTYYYRLLEDGSLRLTEAGDLRLLQGTDTTNADIVVEADDETVEVE